MTNKGNRSSKMGYALMALIIVTPITYQCYKQHQLSLCSRYTIATGSQITGGYQKQYSLECVFYVGGKRYTSSTRFDYVKSSTKNGKDAYRVERHFVRYCCDNPEISELLMDTPIPDHVVSTPKWGWESLPID